MVKLIIPTRGEPVEYQTAPMCLGDLEEAVPHLQAAIRIMLDSGVGAVDFTAMDVTDALSAIRSLLGADVAGIIVAGRNIISCALRGNEDADKRLTADELAKMLHATDLPAMCQALPAILKENGLDMGELLGRAAALAAPVVANPSAPAPSDESLPSLSPQESSAEASAQSEPA